MISLSYNMTQDKNKERSGPAKALKGWIHLIIWLLCIWGFMFLLAPMIQKMVPAVNTLSHYITESGIDAGAIYYTEVEEVGEADQGIRNTFRFYLPQK